MAVLRKQKIFTQLAYLHNNHKKAAKLNKMKMSSH